jgi:ABC-2 type transport system ATP-binding protein
MTMTAMKEEILEAVELTKDYGDHRVLDAVNFSLKQGETVGFVGPNGSGKTTTIKLLLGLITPTSGSVTICGTDLHKDFENAISHTRGFVETPSFYPYLSGWDNLLLSLRMYPAARKDELEHLVETFGLSGRIKDRVFKYSMGMKQRLALCNALIGSPEILLLDEPTNGLDVDGVFEFRDTIRTISREHDVAILISSHILSELEKICDRAIIISKGKIIGNMDLNVDTGKESFEDRYIRISANNGGDA